MKESISLDVSQYTDAYQYSEINTLNSNNYSKTELHKHFQIDIVINGKAKIGINKIKYTVQNGDLIIIPPKIPHIIHKDHSFEIIEVHILSLLVSGLKDTCINKPIILNKEANKVCTKKFSFVIEKIIREYRNKSIGYKAIIKTLLVQLFVDLIRKKSQSNQYDNICPLNENHYMSIQKAIRYIDMNYERQLCIQDVARVSMLSSSYFCKVFKKITSKTFVDYLTEYRLEKSMELLKNTKKTILDVCFDSGFNSISYFHKVFKEKTGMTPKKFRDKSKNNLFGLV